ncbi:nucleoside hydrolase [Halosimplex litoreum]|uniref:Nucleoside hydrolase n=1 Tax=Halosimplex litoreum TaxID=1198301 RepID=A0A7T3G085_9EURY|nr:nucleoside hydrolase [Halosimplex litoreum]QPV63981.1 nucleoside hydrolase [Halosimplex litoreum]
MTDPDGYLGDEDRRAVAGRATADDPVPVVLATDIGTDVDDTWALAQLLRTPQLDCRLVLTETGDPTYRASVAAKLLERADRTDVPIGLGPDGREMDAAERNQAPWVDEYDLDGYPGTVRDGGVEAFTEVVNRADDPVTVVSIGPTPTLATVVERHPEIARECRFVGMHGSFYEGYDGGEPDAETNVRVDPPAFRTVLAAPWRDVLLTPLDTCGHVTLDGGRYHRVWSATDDPLVRGVVENNCVFATRVSWMPYDDFTRRSSTLFDCVAVYLAHDESLVETESLRFDVTDDGVTEPSSDGEFEARVALEWGDRDAFEASLAERLLTR